MSVVQYMLSTCGYISFPEILFGDLILLKTTHLAYHNCHLMTRSLAGFGWKKCIVLLLLISKNTC